MPVCATRGRFSALLLTFAIGSGSGIGCGGKAAASGDSGDGGSDGLNESSGGQAGAAARGDGGSSSGGAPAEEQGGGPTEIAEDPEPEPSCSLPTGTLSSACPMELAPACHLDAARKHFPEFSCELSLEYLPLRDKNEYPEWSEYIDVYLGEFIEDPYADGARLLRVAGPEACSTTGNGWYFDDPNAPAAIHVCPNACDCARSQGGQFAVIEGCRTNAAPGVLDAKIPCPHCAAIRPQSCLERGYYGASGPSIVRCEFPFPDYLLDLNPIRINLRYSQFGLSGMMHPSDGYLTFIPSLSDCDQVEEGWTVDFYTTPPLVRVCPSACSCAKVNNALLLLETGCDRVDL